MITKRATVDQIEVTQSRLIQVRIALEVVEDNVVLSKKYLRTAVSPGMNPSLPKDVVDGFLEEGAWPALSGWERVEAQVALDHTPEVIAEYAAKSAIAARRGRLEQ